MNIHDSTTVVDWETGDHYDGYVDVPIGTQTKLWAGSYVTYLYEDYYLGDSPWQQNWAPLGFQVDDSGRVISTDSYDIGPAFNSSQGAWDPAIALGIHEPTKWTAYFNGEFLQGLSTILRGTRDYAPGYPEGVEYKESFHVNPTGKCPTCTSCGGTGGSSAGLNSLEYTINLGANQLTQFSVANQLTITTKTPTEQLATPNGLGVNYLNQSGNETIFAQDNSPRQVVGPQTWADIHILSPYKYQIDLYPAASKGNKDTGTGLYTPSGAPIKTVTVENPDDSATIYNRLHIVETTAEGSQHDYLYIYTGGYPVLDLNGKWELISDGGVRHETLVSNPVDADNRVETRTVSDGVGKVVSEVRRQYCTYTWGEEVTAETLDPDGAALTTSYDYWHVDVPDPANPPADPYLHWANHLKQMVEPTGYWERYEYDSLDRPTKKTAQYLDAPLNAPDNQCRVTTTSYIDTAPLMETEVESLLGVEVSRRYKRYLGQGKVQEIVCQQVGAAWDDPGNLVTTTVTDSNGNVLSTQQPDGTLTTTSSTVAGGEKTTVVSTGAPSADGSSVVDGTQTTTVIDAGGQQLMVAVVDIASGLTLSTAVTVQSDNLGRPTRVVYADGSAELTSYDCCGISAHTDRDGVTTTYTHDALARLASESRAGVTTLHNYDAADRETSTVRQGSDGSTVTLDQLAYDVAGRQTSRIDALGRTSTYSEAIDAATGHTVRNTTMADQSTQIETHAQDGSLLSVAGTGVHPVSYAYGVDASAGAWQQEFRGGDSAATEWTKTYTDTVGRAYKTQSAAGAVTQSFFNPQGQLIRSVDPDGVTTLYGYDARGAQDTVALDMDRNGQIDFGGTDWITRMMRSVVTAHGTTVARTTTDAWNTNGTDAPAVIAIDDQSVDGHSAWHTDASGLVTQSSTACDGAGTCTTTTTAPDGSYTVGVTQNGRSMAQTRYDANAQVVSGTTLDYDAQGRLWHQTDLRDGVTTFTYDNADQLRSISQAGLTTGYDYDALGRKAVETAPDAGQVQTKYWPTGEIASISGVRTYPQSYSYDIAGRLQTLTTTGAAGVEVTTWHYDPQSGRMTGKAYADGHGPSYTYTAGGKLATRTWARGIVTTYGYDNAGQLQSMVYSDGTTPAASYSYDRLGRLATAAGGGSGRALTYQGNTNLMTSETATAGPTAGISVSTGYDSLLRRTSLQVNQGQTSLLLQNFSFDAASRLANASQGTASAAYAYWANSGSNLVHTITFTNSGQPVMTTTKSYDTLDRLTSTVSTVANSTTPVSGFNYTYNAANERIRADVAADGSHWTYGYDGLGQVTLGSRQWSDNTPVGGQQFAYGFDSIGNRTSTTVNGRQSQYTSNALNQYSHRTVPGAVDVIGTANAGATVTINNQTAARQNGGYFYGTAPANNTQSAAEAAVSVSAVQLGTGSTSNVLATQQGSVFVPQSPENFTYDTDGNLTQDGHWTYTWDGENRLIGMQALSTLLASDRKELAFAYDDAGRRVQKQVLSWNASSSGYSLTSSSLFSYDGWNLSTELNGLNSDALLRTYLWTASETGFSQAMSELMAVTDQTTNAQFVCCDGNRNVTMLVRASDHTITGQNDYGVFGETLRTAAHPSTPDSIRFSSCYTDTESGFVYYGYRFYNPQTGYFLARDPLQEQGCINVHSIVGNDPENHIDYLGLADINIVLTRIYRTLTATVGRMSFTSTNQKAQCCAALTVDTIETPYIDAGIGLTGPPDPNAHGYPYGQTDEPVQVQGPGDSNGRHVTPSFKINEVNNNAGAVNRINGKPVLPTTAVPSVFQGEAGMNNALNSALHLGTGGGVYIHGGLDSYWSTDCIIVGYNPHEEYIERNARNYPGLALGQNYVVTSFTYLDTIRAMTDIAAFVDCVRQHLGRTPTLHFTRTGPNEPPFRK